MILDAYVIELRAVMAYATNSKNSGKFRKTNMIDFNLPPKPGEVTLDAQNAIELLDINGYAQNREELVGGAGYAVGRMLTKLCIDNPEDVPVIIDELATQAATVYKEHHQTYKLHGFNPDYVASVMEYGMKRGAGRRVISDDQPGY